MIYDGGKQQEVNANINSWAYYTSTSKIYLCHQTATMQQWKLQIHKQVCCIFSENAGEERRRLDFCRLAFPNWSEEPAMHRFPWNLCHKKAIPDLPFLSQISSQFVKWALITGKQFPSTLPNQAGSLIRPFPLSTASNNCKTSSKCVSRNSKVILGVALR